MTTRLGDSIRRRTRRPAPRQRRAAVPWKRLVPVAFLGLAGSFGAGYALAVFILFPAPPQAVGGIEVPLLIGRDRVDAERQVAATGLAVGDVVEVSSFTAPAGTVGAQSPVAGQQIRAGATVDFAVSTGRPRATVPDLAGLRRERAEALAGRLGFDVDERIEDSLLPEGQVIAVEPAAGSEFELPARITLVTSSGPPPILPDSVGEPPDTLLEPGRPQPDTLAGAAPGRAGPARSPPPVP